MLHFCFGSNYSMQQQRIGALHAEDVNMVFKLWRLAIQDDFVTF